MKNVFLITSPVEIFSTDLNVKWGLMQKEDDNMEEMLNKFIKENKIKVDDEGNFEMYIVVDVDEEDCEIGTVVKGKTVEFYTEKRAYEDLKDNNAYITNIQYLFVTTSKIINKLKEKISIRKDLLKIEDKMSKVLVNKKDVISVHNDKLYIDKYKIIDHIILKPKLKFKIKNFCKETIEVIIYNDITEKSKTITIRYPHEELSEKTIKDAINTYLDIDEEEVTLYNRILKDGVDL